MQGIHFLVERHCEECKKTIYPTAMWIYKIKDMVGNTKWYCSWTCYKKGKNNLNTSRKRRSFKWRYGSK